MNAVTRIDTKGAGQSRRQLPICQTGRTGSTQPRARTSYACRTRPRAPHVPRYARPAHAYGVTGRFYAANRKGYMSCRGLW